MRNRYFVILGLVGTFMFGACSSSSEDRSSSPGQSNAANGATINGAQNLNTATVTNGMVVQPESVDGNAAVASTDQLQPPNMPDRLGDKMNKLNSSAGTTDVAALALKNARPAPDNSTFTSYLTDAGYEIRTFKNHPQLVKAEKKTTNDGKQTLKVFLRNGRSVEVAGQKIAILASAPASAILEAAGIAEAPSKQPASSATGAKKSSN